MKTFLLLFLTFILQYPNDNLEKNIDGRQDVESDNGFNTNNSNGRNILNQGVSAFQSFILQPIEVHKVLYPHNNIPTHLSFSSDSPYKNFNTVNIPIYTAYNTNNFQNLFPIYLNNLPTFIVYTDYTNRQHHSLRQPNFSGYSNIQANIPNNSLNSSNLKIEKYSTSEYPSFFNNTNSKSTASVLLSRKKVRKKLHVVEIDYILEGDLNNIWRKLIVKKINDLEPKLLDCFFNHRLGKDWKILNHDSKMFNKNENDVIEFFEPENLEKITFYRKKYLHRTKGLIYDYLVVKGEPEKNLKNLNWKGSLLFIMDCSNIGENVTLHGYSFIGPKCKIGDNTFILNNCLFENDVEIEKDTFIGRKNVFEKGCKVGISNFENFLYKFKNRTLFSKIHKQSKYKTKIGNFNYIGNDVVFPVGFDYNDRLYYSYE